MSTRRIVFSLGALGLCICVIAGVALAFYPDALALVKQPSGHITLRSTVEDSEPTGDSEAPLATKTLPDVVTSAANDPGSSSNHADESPAPGTSVDPATHAEESSTPAEPAGSTDHTEAASAPATPADSTNQAEVSPTPSPESARAPAATDVPQSASVNVDDIVHGDSSGAAIAEPPTTASITPKTNPVSDQSAEECGTHDDCVDEYLWKLYQRAPKEDAVKVVQKRSVTVKVDGKSKTVMKEFSTVVDEDFAWKDPKAAEHAGMSLKEYVIGGMDHDFRLKLYRSLRAMDAAGLEPGITSAFRDDYRQSLASGLKAAIDRSYHGGSFRGGYGHGLAADLVSVKGATRAERLVSSDILWAWIDSHSKEIEIGRPYLSKDPPHVGPLDGQEYAEKRGSRLARLARLGLKKLKTVLAPSTPHPHQ
jgi:hypothetical protein